MSEHPLARKLIGRLGDASRSTQRMWLRELRKTGAQTVAELHVLLDDPDVMKRARAAYVLGKVGDRRWTARRLLDLLARPEDDGVRRVAAVALMWLDSPSTRRELVRLLRKHPDAGVRETAAMALSSMHGDIRAVRALVATFGDPKEDPSVRGQAAMALGSPWYWKPSAVHESKPALLKALSDPVPDVRAGAAYALGTVGGQAAIPAIEKLKRDKARAHGRTVAEAAEMAVLQIEVLTNPKRAREAWQRLQRLMHSQR